MVDTNILRDFLCVADAGDFRVAARRQGVTVSALNRRIKAIEQFTGAQLVYRTQVPLALTPAGAEFRALSTDVLSHIKQMDDETGAQPLSSRVRTNVMPEVLSRQLGRAKRRLPLKKRSAGLDTEQCTGALELPVLYIGALRVLTDLVWGNPLSKDLASVLRTQLAQSLFFSIAEGSNVNAHDADFRIEGTLTRTADMANITVYLTGIESQEVLLFKKFEFEYADIEARLRNFVWEIAWNISNAIRHYSFQEAKKLSADERNNYQNFVFAHDSIMDNLIVSRAAVIEASNVMKSRNADIHRLLHVYGCASLRSWMQNPENTSSLSDSIKYFSQVIAENPNYYLCHLSLAAAHCLARDFYLGEIYLKRTLELAPEATVGWLGIGVTQMALGRYSEAIQSFKVSAKYETNGSVFSSTYIALIYYVQGRYLDSADQIEPKRSPFPDAIAIKLAALSQARANSRISLLKLGHSLLPRNAKRFQMARYPLMSAEAEDHLIDGLRQAGIKDIAHVSRPNRSNSPLDMIEFDRTIELGEH